MAEFNNPAGRLYHLVEWLQDQPSDSVSIDVLANRLEIRADHDSVITALLDLDSELQLVIDWVCELDHEIKQQAFKSDLESVRRFFKSFVISIRQGSLNYKKNEKAATALRYIAIDMPLEETIEKSEIEKLRTLASELQSEIEKSEEINGVTKAWLLDLVRIIRDSIDRYKIRGARGMKRQVSLMLGELMQHHQMIQEVTKDKPSVVDRLKDGLTVMVSFAILNEKAPAVIENIWQALTVTAIGLPKP